MSYPVQHDHDGYPVPAATHHRRAAAAERIARMFAEGHDLTTVARQGAVNGWTRGQALQVVQQRGWQLDASGRVPRSQRPAVTPGKPVPSAPSGMPGVGTIGGERPVVAEPKPSPGRAQVNEMFTRAAEILERRAQTPTEKAAAALSPRETAPSTGSATPAGVKGERSPTPPQVSPSRATAGNTRGGGASDVPAASPAPDLPALTAMATAAQQREVADSAFVLLARADASDSARVHELADAARLLLDKLRAALAADEQQARLRTRLAELDAERAAILAQLGENPQVTDDVTPAPAGPKPAAKPPGSLVDHSGDGIPHGSWGGFLAHKYRGVLPVCDACDAAREQTMDERRAKRAAKATT